MVRTKRATTARLAADEVVGLAPAGNGHVELVPSTNSLRQLAAALRLLATVALGFAAAAALLFAISGFASSHPAEGIVGLLLAAAAGSIAALRLRLWREVRRSDS